MQQCLEMTTSESTVSAKKDYISYSNYLDGRSKKWDYCKSPLGTSYRISAVFHRSSSWIWLKRREGRYIVNHLCNNLELLLWKKKGEGGGRREVNLLFGNWPIFSRRRNVLAWEDEDEALTELPFDEYISSQENLILKDLLYRRVTGMVREIEKFCKTHV